MKPLITSREKEVLTLISFEYTTQEIANKLFLSPHTVVSHRKHLLLKFNVRNIAGLVRRGFEEGLLRKEVRNEYIDQLMSA